METAVLGETGMDGRMRRDYTLGGIKYIVMGHNAVRGAAGCAVSTPNY